MELKNKLAALERDGGKKSHLVSEVIAKKKVSASSPKEEEKSAERSLHGLRATCR